MITFQEIYKTLFHVGVCSKLLKPGGLSLRILALTHTKSYSSIKGWQNILGVILMSLVQGRSIKLFHLPAVDDSTSPGRKAPTGASGLILQKTLTGLCFHRRFLFAVSPLSRWLAPLHSQQSSCLPQLTGKLPHKSAQARTRTLKCLVVSSQFSYGRIEGFQVHSMVNPF